MFSFLVGNSVKKIGIFECKCVRRCVNTHIHTHISLITAQILSNGECPTNWFQKCYTIS